MEEIERMSKRSLGITTRGKSALNASRAKKMREKVNHTVLEKFSQYRRLRMGSDNELAFSYRILSQKAKQDAIVRAAKIARWIKEERSRDLRNETVRVLTDVLLLLTDDDDNSIQQF